jgi:hypothetical protein
VDLEIIRDFAKELDLPDKVLPSLLHLDNAKAFEYRRELDTGALNRLLRKRLPLDYIQVLAHENNKNSMRTWPPDRSPSYRLCLLGAAVMRLGCMVRPDFRQFLKELHAKVGFSCNAQVQLRHALNVYVDGSPYNFREKIRPLASVRAVSWMIIYGAISANL